MWEYFLKRGENCQLHFRFSNSGEILYMRFVMESEDEKFETCGSYLSKKKIGLARQIAKRYYDRKVLNYLCRELKLLNSYLKGGFSSGIKNIYKNMIPGRKQLVKAITLPDFYCLNLRTRREFVLEHFGMMDDLDYVESVVRKTELYQESGISTFNGLIVTMETRKHPLSTVVIEKMIKKYLI